MKKCLLCLILIFLTLISFKTKEKNPLFFGVAIEGWPSKDKLKQIQEEIGIKPQMIVFFLMWPKKSDVDKYFNIVSSLKACDEFGAVACITWEPMYLDGKKEHVILKDEILNGSYDEYIDEFAFQIKVYKKPVIIRFAHEMNLDRYHWGIEKKDYDKDAPDIYKKIFKYVANYFKKHNVDNAFFAFCPNVDSVPKASWNEIKNYYPGSRYVDVLGMDGYNWGKCAAEKNMGWGSSWRNFDEVFKKTYSELRNLSVLKPIIIFETASSSRGGNKNLWLKHAIYEAEKMDISVINWFNVDKECDWKLTKEQKNILKNYFLYKTYSIKDWIREALE
jgi:hypothetical protein